MKTPVRLLPALACTLGASQSRFGQVGVLYQFNQNGDV